jgi:hypothetical protein
MRTLIVSACLLAASPAYAGPRVAADDDSDKKGEDEQLVILNASPKLGDRGHMDRIRRVLDSRGMLLKLPDRIEATLEGVNVQITDLDAIRDAYTKMEFTSALELVQADENRILQAAAGGDPVPALAELAQWKGRIAAGMEQSDEAVKWFRAAVRLNPAWSPTGINPKLRPLIKQARKEVDETGKLRIAADPDGAMVKVDDGKPQTVKDKLTLAAGYHLVMVTAEGRTTYAELVDIAPGKTYKLEIALEKESKSDRVAKAVDAAITAPPGKTRLKKTKALSQYAGGAKRFLVLEDATDSKVTLRVYDIATKKVSKPLELDGQLSSAAIARKVLAALEPDNFLEPTNIMIIEKQRKQHWYERWYVWAGVAAIAGGGYLGYHYATREPTSIRGF